MGCWFIVEINAILLSRGVVDTVGYDRLAVMRMNLRVPNLAAMRSVTRNL